MLSWGSVGRVVAWDTWNSGFSPCIVVPTCNLSMAKEDQELKVIFCYIIKFSPSLGFMRSCHKRKQRNSVNLLGGHILLLTSSSYYTYMNIPHAYIRELGVKR